MTHKICTKCRVEKPASDFTIRKDRKNGTGLHSACKECGRKANAQWRVKNTNNEEMKEKRRAADRERYAANPEKYCESQRKRRQDNPEKIRELDRKNYTNNREKKRESKRIYHAKNADKLRERDRQRYWSNVEESRKEQNTWRSANRDHVNQRQRSYYAQRPEKMRESARYYGIKYRDQKIERNRKRRALQKGATVREIRPEFYSEKLAECNGRCVYCQVDLKSPGIITHWDHVIPLVKGGEHSEANLVPACSVCNLQKHDLDVKDFLARRKSQLLSLESRLKAAYLSPNINLSGSQ